MTTLEQMSCAITPADPDGSRSEHYDEWAHEVSRVLNNVPEDMLEEEARTLEESGYSIHFHVWTPIAWLELLSYCARTGCR